MAARGHGWFPLIPLEETLNDSILKSEVKIIFTSLPFTEVAKMNKISQRAWPLGVMAYCCK